MEMQLRGLSVQAALVYVQRLKIKGGCQEFHKLVKEIRESVSDGAIEYCDIGISEIELLELGAHNASCAVLKGLSNTFGDLCLASMYACEATRIRARSSRVAYAGMAAA